MGLFGPSGSFFHQNSLRTEINKASNDEKKISVKLGKARVVVQRGVDEKF